MSRSSKDKDKLKVKGWKMILQANATQREAGVALLIRQDRLQDKKNINKRQR